jgi:hypothetical protein
MSKHDDKKRKGFREFYEEDDRKPNRKRVDETYRDKMRFKDKIKRFDLKNYSEEDFDEDYFN